MARFLNPVMGLLDRILNINSAQKTTTRIDLENGMQMVFDGSRIAERGTGIGQHGGFLLIGTEQDTVGADEDEVSVDPYGFIGTGRPDNFSVWLMGASAWAEHDDAADIDGLSVMGIVPAGTFLGSAVTRRLAIPAFAWDAVNGTIAPWESQGLGNFNEGLINLVPNPSPILLPHGSTVMFTWDVGGACEFAAYALLWVGGRNCLPPGMT